MVRFQQYQYWAVYQLHEETFTKNVKPEILNTDQGTQVTSDIFATNVLCNGVKSSMYGKVRNIDNAFIERH